MEDIIINSLEDLRHGDEIVFKYSSDSYEDFYNHLECLGGRTVRKDMFIYAICVFKNGYRLFLTFNDGWFINDYWETTICYPYEDMTSDIPAQSNKHECKCAWFPPNRNLQIKLVKRNSHDNFQESLQSHNQPQNYNGGYYGK